MRELLGVTQRVPVLSVSDLNRLLRVSLETDFAEVWVAGEISSLRTPGSGHHYFCLKDRRSQIAAVVFRSVQRTLPFRLRDGLEVVAHGRISMYEPRGDLQLMVDTLEPRGVGSVQLALEQLKQRLAAEGLFDAARKRPLPFWPRAVGVITARSGAAVRDIVATIRARLPAVRIILRTVRVQGRLAGADITAALAELADGARHRSGDRRARRRIGGGSVGVQRGTRRPRHRRLSGPGRVGGRPRDRRHPRRSRRRLPRRHADGRRGNGRPRPRRSGAAGRVRQAALAGALRTQLRRKRERVDGAGTARARPAADVGAAAPARRGTE